MPVKRYEVRQPNGSMATLKLNDADAKRLGVFEEPKTSEAAAPATKKRTPANKSRTAKNKG